MYEFKDVKKILVIKLRHIGDVLLIVPVLRALRENFPGAQISALVNSGTQDVLSGIKYLDEIIIFNRNIKKMGSVQKYYKELLFLNDVRAKGFDMTVDLTSGDRAAFLSFYSGARYRFASDPGRSGFPGKRRLYTHISKKNNDQHMVLQNLDVVSEFGIRTDDLSVEMFIPDDAKEYVENIFKQNGIKNSDIIVHVHPTSRWLFKCWKDEYMAGVINWLLEKGIKVIVTAAPEQKEMDKAKEILSLVNLQPSLIDLCGKTTIKQLAAIAAASDVFFGVDTAPMHIAAAVGPPVLALFGPTGVEHWGPWGEKNVVLSKDMPCKPCRLEICEHYSLRKCLEDITEEEVRVSLLSMLENIDKG